MTGLKPINKHYLYNASLFNNTISLTPEHGKAQYSDDRNFSYKLSFLLRYQDQEASIIPKSVIQSNLRSFGVLIEYPCIDNLSESCMKINENL